MSRMLDSQETDHSQLGAEYDPREIRRSIGSQMADARKKARLTQMQLSAKTGVDQAVISRIERGKANPTVTLLQTVATPLGLRVSLVPAHDDAGEES